MAWNVMLSFWKLEILRCYMYGIKRRKKMRFRNKDEDQIISVGNMSNTLHTSTLEDQLI